MFKILTLIILISCSYEKENNMTDKEKYIRISQILNSKEFGEEVFNEVSHLLASFDDINFNLHGDNLLKLFCKQSVSKIVYLTNGEYRHEIDTFKLVLIKMNINVLINKDVDKDHKMGLYNAPVLFFTEDPYIFRYVCELGFNPNERLKLSGYKGYPFFMLHHNYRKENYLTAKEFGFNIKQEISGDKNLLHLFFSKFIEFDVNTIEDLLNDFDENKNDYDTTSGFTPLMMYVSSIDENKYSYEVLEYLVNNGMDIKAKSIKTVWSSDYEIPIGSTVYDIIKIKNPILNEWDIKMLELLNPKN